MLPDGVRCKGDLDLEEVLLGDRAIRSFIDSHKDEYRGETRRYLLGTAVRITPEMAPSLHQSVDACAKTLEVKGDVELYVSPSPHFNAFSYGGNEGRIFLGLTSTLLEAFAPDELSFVIGHELGHYIFKHHDIPVAALLREGSGIRPEQALQLFSWQRYAEISADRAGLLCVRSLDATARAFFKLASGLRGRLVEFDIDQYLAQVGDIEAEASTARRTDERPRSDWFASHPFSPLRVRASQLCSNSVLLKADGNDLADLESQVHELMSLMEPSYLLDKSETGEAMRRILLAGGVLVAAANGQIEDSERQALEDFLGAGTLPTTLDADAFRDDLRHRVQRAKEHVPPLKRAQVVRDLCVIAHADGHTSAAEAAVIRQLAVSLDVDPTLIECTEASCSAGLD
jgi:tellurite resistance protein